MQDQLCIGTRLKQRAASFQSDALSLRVRKVAVMDDRKGTSRERVGRQRPNIACSRASCCRITNVSDCAAADDAAHFSLIKGCVDQSRSFAADDAAVIIRPGDAGGFLSAVL